MRRALILCCLPIFVLRAFAAEAFHGAIPLLTQLTPIAQNPGTIQDIRYIGMRMVVFSSDADLLNNGSTGRQIFLFDLQETLSGSPALTQLSTTPLDDNRRPATGRTAATVTYDARIGGVGPRQLMLLQRHKGLHTQITNGGFDSKNASVDEHDTVVVFESDADFFATGVGGTQIYRISLKKAQLGLKKGQVACPFPCLSSGNAGLSQITNKVGTSRNAVTSNGGKWIVFESDADLLNVGQTENQIYLYDSQSGRTSLLSHGPGAARHPALTQSGGRIVFESDANLTGSGTGGTQIFLYHRSKATLQQITTPPGGTCTNPSIASNGPVVAFISPNNLLGLGGVTPQLYSYSLRRKILFQLTNGAASVSSPGASGNFFTTFLAAGDLAGNGSPGTHLYLVNLFKLGNQTIP